MSPLKVYFLDSMNAGTAFYRMWQFKQEMNKQGIAQAVQPFFDYKNHEIQPWQFEVSSNPQVYHSKGFLSRMIQGADVVVVQYVHSWESLALIEAFKAAFPDKVFLTEIDDYVLDTPTYNDAFEQYQPGWRFREIIVAQMQALDGIITSTPFLKEAYAEFNDNIYVVPNCVDFSKWTFPTKKHTGLRVGWIGGASHEEDLKSIEKPMTEYLKARDNTNFYCVHGTPEFFKNKSKVITPRDWVTMDKYPKAFSKHGFDIGIAPLVDNNFNRGKSNLRNLEYGAMGIPVVAANVGEFARTVGKGGILYNNEKEFKDALELLSKDKKLRKEMGDLNIANIQANFNLFNVAQDYVEILKECHKRGQTTKVDVSAKGGNKWTEKQQEPSSA